MTTTYKTGSIPAAGSGYSDVIGVNEYYSFQANWSGVDTNDGTLEIEVSNDGTNWNTRPGTPVVMVSIPASTQVWEILKTSINFVRLKYTRVTATAGSIDWIFEGT